MGQAESHKGQIPREEKRTNRGKTTRGKSERDRAARDWGRERLKGEAEKTAQPEGKA